MFDISFGSTYRIPITQSGVNNAKKERLRTLIESYPNGVIGKSKTGYARVSVPEELDNTFESKLKGIGYKVFQKFDGHDVSKDNLDLFIKEKLDKRKKKKKGKKMKRMSREMKEQRRFERRYTPPAFDKDNIEQNGAEKISNDVTVRSVDTLKKQTRNLSGSIDNIEANQEAELDRIKQTEGYLKLKNEYGEEFADAVYFGLKK